MSREPQLAEGRTSRTACARTVLRSGVDDRTGEPLPAPVLSERVRWCADLTAGVLATWPADPVTFHTPFAQAT